MILNALLRATALTARGRSVAIFCAAQMTTIGCSLMQVRPSPEAGGAGRAECKSRAFPVLDGIGAVGLAIGAAFTQSYSRALSDCGRYPNDSGCHSSPAIWIPAAALAASSAYGFWAVTRCESQLPNGEDQASLRRLDEAMSDQCGAALRGE